MSGNGLIGRINERADILKDLLRELDAGRRANGSRNDDRIEQVRHLAGEVIHALNNSVGGVLLSTEYALANLDDRENLERALRNIKVETLHCHTVVRTLLGSLIEPVAMLGDE